MPFLVSLIMVLIVVAVPVAAFIALSRTNALRRRVEELERGIRTLRRETEQLRRAAGSTRAATAGVMAAHPTPPPTASAMPLRDADPPAVAASAAAPRFGGVASRPEPDGIERLLQIAWGWFTEGNVPVKVGMVVLFAGVGALLKYASDQGWMRFPIEWRLAGIGVAACAGLVFGWRQRHQRRVFALSVQGGAIGVLLMTAFAAFKLYGLLGSTAAFMLWVVLAAAAGGLAVFQEARALAVLGILAGFLAPIAMSTGSGNHVVLFTFYAVLNAAIFGIAWFRVWPGLNLLGFAFTFGIGTLWGVVDYEPGKFSTTLPFLLLFFGFYLLIPILNARHRNASVRDPVEASLVFGTPLLAFVQLAGLLEVERMPLAAGALVASVLYALLAWLRAAGASVLLRQCHIVLAVGFATLSVPLALSAQATASVFAVEGAALVWLGLAQSRRLALLAGAALQLLAAVGYIHGYDASENTVAILNQGFMGALLLTASAFASAVLHARARARSDALAYYLWGLAWWLVLGNVEISRFVAPAATADARLAFAALTAVAAALALRVHAAAVLSATVAAALAAALPLAVLQSAAHAHPFAASGIAAWAAYAVLGTVALHGLRAQEDSVVPWAHAAWLFAWPLALMLWLQHLAGAAHLASGWRNAAVALPWLLACGAVQLRPQWISWPLAQYFARWRPVLQAVLQLVVASIALVLLALPGSAAPLPWIPLLNPLELVLLSALALLAAGLRAPSLDSHSLETRRSTLLPLGLFLVLTSLTLRAVHQLGGVPWSTAMFDSALAQASLSLVWSVLGVAGWVAGSRRRQRVVWGIGAVLMGVVLAKLVLVDRQHLGNLPGIASFIGYGLLCTVVGYLAPAPPRRAEPASQPA